MILKLQKPLYPKDAPILVYDESRRNPCTIPVTPALEQMFGPKVKIYATAHVAEDGSLSIDKVVPDRSW